MLYRLTKLEDDGFVRLSTLPFSIRVLLESVLRNCDGYQVSYEDVTALAAWVSNGAGQVEVPFNEVSRPQ